MDSNDEESEFIIADINAIDSILENGKKKCPSPIEIVEIDTDFIPKQEKNIKPEMKYPSPISYQNKNNNFGQDSDNFVSCLESVNDLGDTDDNSDSDAKLQELLELNKKLIQNAIKARDKLKYLLEECHQKQKILKELIDKTQSPSSETKATFLTPSMPYFKDKSGFAAPKNKDAETKAKNGELSLIKIPKVIKWNANDKNILLKSIEKEFVQSSKELNYGHLLPLPSNQISKLVKEKILECDKKNFDWLKIANQDFENKHSGLECEVMWKMFLHPKINKQKWTKEEDKSLLKISEKYTFENWDKIAKDLGTNRSGYQCFVRYNTNTWKNLMKGQSWTQADDDCLNFLVSKLEIGDYIPWGKVAMCMNHFTKQQVYFRWIYSLSPHLKKGRFSAREDEMLLAAVEKYGTQFQKISALVLPNRTHVQLKDHYNTLILKNSGDRKPWTLEDDKQLLCLKQEHGPNWAKIAPLLSRPTTRTQARQRHAALTKILSKGVSLEQVTRNIPQPNEEIKPTDITTLIYVEPSVVVKKNASKGHRLVDQHLINYFKDQHAKKRLNTGWKYSEEKLITSTHQIFKLLEHLNAKLFLPLELEEKLIKDDVDIELVNSLRHYANNCHTIREQRLLDYHVKMFGPNGRKPAEKKFEIPLPHGCYSRKKKSTKSQKLDYELDRNEYHQVVLDENFSDSESKEMESVIGEYDLLQINKINTMPIKVKCGQKRSNFSRLKIKDFAIDRFDPPQPEPEYECYEQILPDIISNYRSCKYDWQLGRLVFTNDFKEKLLVGGVPINIIEPNISILTSYQQILAIFQNICVSSNVPLYQNNVTRTGLEALSLLKKRFEQLYIIPMGMSKMVPVDVEKQETRRQNCIKRHRKKIRVDDCVDE